MSRCEVQPWPTHFTVTCQCPLKWRQQKIVSWFLHGTPISVFCLVPSKASEMLKHRLGCLANYFLVGGVQGVVYGYASFKKKKMPPHLSSFQQQWCWASDCRAAPFICCLMHHQMSVNIKKSPWASEAFCIRKKDSFPFFCSVASLLTFHGFYDSVTRHSEPPWRLLLLFLPPPANKNKIVQKKNKKRALFAGRCQSNDCLCSHSISGALLLFLIWSN